MANTTVYPYGTNGSLPSSIGIINDLQTGGVDKALSAEMGKEINEILTTKVAVSTSGLSEVNAFINYSSPNNWTSGNSSYKCKFLSVNSGERYFIVGNASRYSYAAVLTSTSHTNGTPASFATGCTIQRFQGPTTIMVEVPSDGKYLYFATLNNGNDCSPASISQERSNYNILSEQLTEQFTAINSKVIDTSMLSQNAGWLINSSNKWNKGDTSSYACYTVPITAGEDYIIFGGTTGGMVAILASATKVDQQAVSFATGYSGRFSVSAGKSFPFTAPEDARYVYLNIKSSGYVRDPYLAIPKPIAQQVAEIGGGEDEAKKDGFNTAPEYFAWKKIEQASKIKWTPLKGTIQKARSQAMFEANTEQTGMPYSSVAELDKRIGEDVSFHTFMTALHNPYSLMYTECVRYGYSRSAYGRQYYGPANSGPYYGMVCSSFVAYALGCVPYTTASWAKLATAGIASVVYDQSANGVQRGDVLWQSGHVRIVQDVWRKNGVVTNVLINEELEPIIKNNTVMTAAAFNALLAEYDIIIYRYNELYKNINYTPSPYVAVADETPETVTYNDDICTFAGDMASFSEDDLIYIHCLNLDYPQMELYKNNTLVETITLASDSRAALTSDEHAYAVNLSNDNLTYGSYKCRLKNGDTYSDYTYFEIINAVVTVDGNTATYSSANGSAVYWYYTEYQSTDGQTMNNVTPLSGQSSGTIDVSGKPSNLPRLKVLFRGEYGNIAGSYLWQ